MMKRILSFTLMSALLSTSLFAQFSTKKAPIKLFQRFEFGVDLDLHSNQFVHDYAETLPIGHDNREVLYEEYFETKLNSLNLGGHIGTRVPLFTFAPNSIIALSVEAGYIVNQFRAKEYTFYGNQKMFIETFNVGVLYAPIGIEMKFGADAMLDKSLKTGYTIGGGISPFVVQYFHKEHPFTSTYYRPFIKGEVAFGNNMFYKIRLMAFFNNVDYMNTYGEGLYRRSPGQEMNLKYIESGSSIMISFIRLLGSKNWVNNF